MTEQQNSSGSMENTTTEETVNSVQQVDQQTDQQQKTATETYAFSANKKEKEEKKKEQEKKSSGLITGAIAIAIILAIGGGTYYLTQQKMSATVQQFADDNAQLKAQIAQLKQQQSANDAKIDQFIQAQATQSDQLKQQEVALQQNMEELQKRISALSNSDVKSWLLAQADFLVKMAERKLWNDQDVLTAMALLKNADASLAEMNDPSLLEIRRAINSDITTLATVSQIDFDGIILRLSQLANQVDNLRIGDNNRDGAPMDSENSSSELSTSLSDWRQNLTKSWKGFMDNFVTVRRRDSNTMPLLAPDQDIYVRENIRAQLLIAAQAVPRHQESTYKQSLEAVSTWVRAYFNESDPSTIAFLQELDTLIEQPISLSIPDELHSQPLLDKLVQKRIRSLLAGSETTASSASTPIEADAQTEAQNAEPAADTVQPNEQPEG